MVNESEIYCAPSSAQPPRETRQNSPKGSLEMGHTCGLMPPPSVVSLRPRQKVAQPIASSGTSEVPRHAASHTVFSDSMGAGGWHYQYKALTALLISYCRHQDRSESGGFSLRTSGVCGPDSWCCYPAGAVGFQCSYTASD